MYSQAPEIESINAWTSPLFVTTNPDHEFIKDDLLAYIYEYQKNQSHAIDSHVAITAKHQLFESKLNFHGFMSQKMGAITISTLTQTAHGVVSII